MPTQPPLVPPRPGGCPILVMTRPAAEMRAAAGQELIGLTVGEPDFGLPPHELAVAGASALKLRSEALAAAVAPRTRWLVLNAPGSLSDTVSRPGGSRTLATLRADHPHVLGLADNPCRPLASPRGARSWRPFRR